jgi:hypothetical protein
VGKRGRVRLLNWPLEPWFDETRSRDVKEVKWRMGTRVKD